MAYFKEVLLLTVAFFALTTVLQAATIYKNPEHDSFFHKLSDQEKEILMALAIAHYDVPDAAEHRGNKTSIMPITPMVKPRAEEIPATLFASMMNGEVSGKWMKDFLYWLEKDMKISNTTLDKFRNNPNYDKLCSLSADRCYSLSDLGAQCCPFG